MTNSKSILKEFEVAVLERDSSILKNAFQKAESSGLAMDSILKALMMGLDAVRMKLKDHTDSIPEFLLSVDVMREGFSLIKTSKSAEKDYRDNKRIVIGVVEGDVHDLGKNIVAGVMEACGYEVIDLGKDVSAALFIEEIRRAQASIMALSTMMSTPLENMEKTIAWCRREFPDVAIMVGGAPLDEEIAKRFGADGYAESAVTVPEEIKRVLEKSEMR